MKIYFSVCFRMIILSLLLGVPPSDAFAAVLYVASGASGGNNGSSWTDAYTNLQTAITASASGDEIWVKAGTYTPSSESNSTTLRGDARYHHFHLKNGVAIYGGFAGDEAALDQRDLKNNPTLLSGGSSKMNIIYHNGSFSPIQVNNTAVLDGFTLTGAVNSAVLATDSSPTIRNCTFTNNQGYNGAAINAKPATTHMYVTNCTFANNGSIGGNGGAVFANGYYGKDIVLTNCTFAYNSAGNGGAIFNAYGGCTIMNATFASNTATNGRAIYNDYSAGSTLTNSILWNGGSEIYNTASAGITVAHSVVDGGYSGTGNTSDEPKLDPGGPKYNGGPVQTIAISRSGSAFDAGTDAGAPTTDARGVARPMYDAVDIGAYESAPPSPLYVDSRASGTGDGSSWANAFTDLQTALNSARYEENDLWVAAGTYKPQGGLRDSHFTLKNGVAVYGGFTGTENSLEERKVHYNETILSGDIGTEGEMSDNCYHVFFHDPSSELDASAILDGFFIMGGNADGAGDQALGAGMYNKVSSPTVRNCTFAHNSAAMYGGGMYNEEASPEVSNCTFVANSAGKDGGAMLNAPGADARIVNTTFFENTAGVHGGGMLNAESTPTVINCTFTENSSGGSGAAMYNASASTIVVNSIFWNNGTEIDNDSGAAPNISFCVIQGGYGGTGANNSDADPLLRPNGLDWNGGPVETVAIQQAGSAYNAGTATNAPLTDARGTTRPQFEGYDIGAFEIGPEDLSEPFHWEMFLPAIINKKK